MPTFTSIPGTAQPAPRGVPPAALALLGATGFMQGQQTRATAEQDQLMKIMPALIQMKQARRASEADVPDATVAGVPWKFTAPVEDWSTLLQKERYNKLLREAEADAWFKEKGFDPFERLAMKTMLGGYMGAAGFEGKMGPEGVSRTIDAFKQATFDRKDKKLKKPPGVPQAAWDNATTEEKLDHLEKLERRNRR